MENDMPFPESETKIIIPNLFDSKVTKERIEVLVSTFVQKFTDGQESALPVYLKTKTIAEYIGGVVEQLAPMALNEVEKLHPQEREMFGIPFTVADGGQKKYSYAHDPVWRNLHAAMECAKVALSDREELMVKAMDFKDAVDDDGVVIPPAELVSAGKTSLRVTIPKK